MSLDLEVKSSSWSRKFVLGVVAVGFHLSDELRDNHGATASTTVDAPTRRDSCGPNSQADQFSFASRRSLLVELLVDQNDGQASTTD